MIILFLSSVEGASCSVRVVAEAREDFVALRDKTFTAFRKECRGKNGVERTSDCSSCSFSTEPASPPRFDFVLRPIIPPFRLEFTVKANADALVALAESQTKGSIFAEIGVGGWGI
ncbi:uncharacterized protein LOC110984328 isoform X2 [Acanthaster planci]|uniref:Uncharacterized protein LOC110984328 isoform X2 n=1 Tax=Acanthaster planci TaxID=133434 RepID=A0A8B7Z5K3_ACAPL|nr:uncharacterized protein LOC110984328 isoform X2 [Acanthaster planci]